MAPNVPQLGNAEGANLQYDGLGFAMHDLLGSNFQTLNAIDYLLFEGSCLFRWAGFSMATCVASSFPVARYSNGHGSTAAAAESFLLALIDFSEPSRQQ